MSELRLTNVTVQTTQITLFGGSKLLLACMGIAAIVFGLMDTPQVFAQSRTADWQTAAGGKLAFDVASVKKNKSGLPDSNSNVAMGRGDYYTPTGGFFTATNMQLFYYILFAYKATGNQVRILEDEVPKWVLSDRFDIQARAESNPTKDQMRQMMQSVLGDRFNLSVHTETRQLPVFALTELKANKFGPYLQPHPDSTPCSSVPEPATNSAAPTPVTVARGFPKTCGGIQLMTPNAPGHIRVGARNVTMDFIATALTAIGSLDRAVLDQTGLAGTFDFILEWVPERNSDEPPSTNLQIDDSGPTFLVALQEQLGLKLVSQKGPVDVLVVDHIDQPSEN